MYQKNRLLQYTFHQPNNLITIEHPEDSTILHRQQLKLQNALQCSLVYLNVTGNSTSLHLHLQVTTDHLITVLTQDREKRLQNTPISHNLQDWIDYTRLETLYKPTYTVGNVSPRPYEKSGCDKMLPRKTIKKCAKTSQCTLHCEVWTLFIIRLKLIQFILWTGKFLLVITKPAG